LQPESRVAYARLLSQGWTDALRTWFPEERIYTFWDYFRNHWQRNSGLRIDHLLLSASLKKRLVNAGVDREVRGAARASDHAPVWIELSDAALTASKAPVNKRISPRKTSRPRRNSAAPRRR
jgi:exodeoxyribonuclease III